MPDSHGYLWIATSKGVARYNGYGFRVFNQADGISNEDIWELCEDACGRVWLSNVSDEFGYIYNSKYHKSVVKGGNYTIYPRDVRRFHEGIIFCSSFIGGDGNRYLCIEKNDTIYKHSISTFLPKIPAGQNIFFSTTLMFDETGVIALLWGGSEVYKVNPENDKPTASLLFKITDSTFVRNSPFNFNVLTNNHLVSYPSTIKSNAINVVNLADGRVQKITMDTYGGKGFINYVYFDNYGDRKFYVILDDNILQFECADTARYLASLPIKDYLGARNDKNVKISTFHFDPYWGRCTGTTSGLYMGIKGVGHFRKNEQLNLENYGYVGGYKDSISFWWSEAKTTLARVEWNGSIAYFRDEHLKRVYCVVPRNRDSFYVEGIYNFLFLNKTGKFLAREDNLTTNIHDFIVDDTAVSYAITSAGFVKTTKTGPGTYNMSYVDRDRYTELIYDSVRSRYVAYNFDRMQIHSRAGKDTVIANLGQFGIQNIEKIAVDNTYGNFFLKGSNVFNVYDFDNGQYHELFENYNLRDAQVLVYGRRLIVAGRMGVLVSQILGRGNISKPLFFPNPKNSNFSNVSDLLVLDGRLTVNTDRGVFSLAMPTEQEVMNAGTDSSLLVNKFIVIYGDTLRNFDPGKVLAINQHDRRMQFDFINPYGNGEAKYLYSLGEGKGWRKLNANELVLPASLAPGKYYNLAVKVYDNVLKTNPFVLRIYIVPYWYQTVNGERIIWIGGCALLLIFTGLIIFLTRKSVLRKEEKRNRMMELELKSLYAQLNPHFVFNTLNSALNFIRKERLEDATAHISRFARLLRSYLDSSRSRFISLSTELENLRNYIEIQLTRFGGVFSYQIVLDPAITDPGSILIPSLLLQPVVENAISHGLLPKEGSGQLTVEIKRGATDDEIICTVDDNGIGRAKSRELKENSSVKKDSHGSDLVNELIAIINKFERFRIDISYIDKVTPETGTTVILKIKRR